MPSEPVNADSWHLDKKVPISLIVVLIVQIFGFGMWLSRIESQVGQVAKDNDQQSAEISNLKTASQVMAERAATVAERLEGLRDSIGEIKVAQRETNDLLRDLAGRGEAP